MRKFNVELNVSKLNTLKVQLSQIETRMLELNEKYKSVQSQFEAKALQVSELETAIKLAQTTPSVS
jgi:chromosome segregation ATPase